MKKIRFNACLLFLFIFSLLAGCTPSKPSLSAATLTPTMESSPTPTQTPLPTIAPSPTPTPLPLDGKQTQYIIDATIDYYNRFVTVESRTIYINKTNQPLTDIVFVVYPTIFQAIYTRSVTVGDGDPVENYHWAGHVMVIPLEQALQPDQKIEFTHKFDLYMPDRGGVFSHSGKQLNLSYWFPFVPPYDENEGWLAHDPQLVNNSFVGEFFIFEAADFDVTITFTDRRESFMIAAPTVPHEEDGTISYQLGLARTFVLSISDQFVLFERQVEDTTIQSFALKEHAPVGEVTADVAVEAFTLFSELYGPYDRELLAVVEFNSDIGMEFDGLIFLSPYFYNLYPGTPQSNIHVYTAHEIAHQWFFSQVGNDQAMEPWLDEAFAAYSERIFYETCYPEHLDWYWENYITAHSPRGNIDISIYFGGDILEYRNIVYRNGALFLHDLRTLLGDEAFFGFVREYVRSYRYKIATGNDFFQLLVKSTDIDLTPLFEEYFSTLPEITP